MHQFIILTLDRLTDYLSAALFFQFSKSRNPKCPLVITGISFSETRLADAEPKAMIFLHTTGKMSLWDPCRIPRINTGCSWDRRLYANWAQSTPETWKMLAPAVLRVSCSRVNYAGLVTKHLSPSAPPPSPRCASRCPSLVQWQSRRIQTLWKCRRC